MSIVKRLCAAFTLRDKIAASRTRLYKVALAWCGDAMVADDLVQETLALALNKSHQLRDPDRLFTWMYSILYNCWKAHLRQLKPNQELDEEVLPSEASVETLSSRIEVIERVRAAISALPVSQREAITLVDLEGFSYAEVAEILDIPIGTVMSRISRARGSLQRVLRSIRPGNDTANLAKLRRAP